MPDSSSSIGHYHHRENSLLVVVVNYRTPDLTIACLASLAKQIPALTGARVVVVDNGSGDGSAARISRAIGERGWKSWAQLRALRCNGGFAYGNNRGLERQGRPSFVLLLNSDTVVHPGCLDYCLQAMTREPDIGALSCKLLSPDGSIQNVARKFPTPARQLCSVLGLPWHLPRYFAWADIEDQTWDRHQVKRDVDWLGGAFLMIRGSVLERIGGLDEDFFFYGEDVEFCHRVWKAGYRCHYDPGTSITHLGGRSSDPGQHNPRLRRARQLVQRKCYGRSAATAVLAADLAMTLLRRFRPRRGKGPSPVPPRQPQTA